MDADDPALPYPSVPLLSPEGTGDPESLHWLVLSGMLPICADSREGDGSWTWRPHERAALRWLHEHIEELAELRTTVSRLTRERDEAREDTTLLDWLDSHGELAIYFVRDRLQFNTGSQSLRSAIRMSRASRSPDQEASR